jgi:hypothetical protein
VTAVPPLVVTGMHRSGTSLVASIAQAVGVDIGQELHPADAANRKGYFEDVDFLTLDRAAVAACCDREEPGWTDWGWTASETFDRTALASFRDEAAALVASRSARSSWGWKDPRTILLLDFWCEFLPDARYVLVYRPPWEVADSLFRLRHPAFSSVPDFPFRVWSFYNRQLLDFARRRPDRCVVLPLDSVLAEPDATAGRIAAAIGAPAPGAADELTDHDMVGRSDRDSLFARLCERRAPESLVLLDALDRVATTTP